ncbi:hypothetical protein JP008_00330 [Staphylococcus aureus]|nr:hypothetical protein JP008_00330 [Staphylococcus aureus]
MSLKTLYRKRTVIWPFYFYTIIRTLSSKIQELLEKDRDIRISNVRKAKYNIQGNIEMYEKLINEIISK